MKIYNIFGRPEEREPIHMSEVLAAADARPVLPAPSATDRLQRNLERGYVILGLEDVCFDERYGNGELANV